METAAKLYSLSFGEKRTYLFALLFIAGNLLLPQLCHLVPQGGMILLPIYFFTLIAAYKFGLKVGLLTALVSPILNSVLFGMPVVTLLPIILVKSTLLAVAASVAARYTGRVTLTAVVATVIAYQALGMLFEWAYTSSLSAAMQDIRLGLPGMLLQGIGGYALLRLIAKR